MENDLIQPFQLRLPKDWVPQLDGIAKDRFISRHALILQAVRKILDEAAA